MCKSGEYDLVILGGEVIDGSGEPPRRADVGVRGHRIAEVGDLRGADAGVVIDAACLYVCPGFIDVHAHTDLAFLTSPWLEARVHQGVTLDVLCQDGLGLVPLRRAAFPTLSALLREWNGSADGAGCDWESVEGFVKRMSQGAAINAAFLAPHGTIRLLVIGMDERAPSEAELSEMAKLVGECMEGGAVGLSTGLQYPPAMHASEAELVALCKEVAAYGGYFAPHLRDYGRAVFSAVEEAFRIARQSGVALHLTHAHLSYGINAGRAAELLTMVDEARQDGLDVTLDSYPYTSGQPYMRMLLPPWITSGGDAATLSRISDRGARTRLRYALEVEGFEGVPVDWSRLEIASVSNPANSRWLGMSIDQAAAWAAVPPFELFCDLLISDSLRTVVIEHIGNEENVQAIMRHGAHMPASDGIVVGDRPHPRAWGTFPRILGHYTRDLGLFTWEEAVKKVTSLPARRLGLSDRGLIRCEMVADVVCFDPLAVRETATFETPRSAPEGIPHVIVNGVQVVRDGVHTGALPGRMLRRGESAVSAKGRVSR